MITILYLSNIQWTSSFLYTYLNFFNSVTLFNVKSIAYSKKYRINSKRNYFSKVVHFRNKIQRHSNTYVYLSFTFSFICRITNSNCVIRDQRTMATNKIQSLHHHHHVPGGLGGLILFLNPQDEVGPSISSLVVPCSFVLMVYIVMLVLVVYLCPSFVRVVATFFWHCLISFTILCDPANFS